MGNMQAAGYAEGVQEGWWNLDNALYAHLTGNFYPPHPSYMVGPCKRAIAKANKGLWNSRVRLPEEAKHRVYGSLVPVHIMVEAMHLDAFIEYDEEDYDDE